MAKSMTMATAIVAGATVVAFWGPALAQTGSSTTGPTQADFDYCNREAQMKAGGSASPSGTSSTGAGTSVGTPGVGSSSTVSGGTGVTAGSPGSGSLGTSSSGGSVDTQSGATGGGSVSSSGAGTSAAGASGGSSSGGSTLGSSTDTSGDAQLRGIAAAGQSDPGYQSAYRDCMQSRGF